jgi:hypothetical protein
MPFEHQSAKGINLNLPSNGTETGTLESEF